MSQKKGFPTPRQAGLAHTPGMHPAISVDGSGDIRISSDLLELPSRAYDADIAGAVHRDRTVSLFFAKRSLNQADHLRTRLEVRMGEDVFLRHLWENSRAFHERLRKYLELDTVPVEHPERMSADADHSDWANVCSLAHTGNQGVLDFYNLSPSGLARYIGNRMTSGLQVSPVVRIQTSSITLLSLLDACIPLAETIQRALRSKVESP